MNPSEENARELSLVITRFLALVRRWRLEQSEVLGLLGLSPLSGWSDDAQGRFALSRLEPSAERRMRLLLDVDGRLHRLVPEEDIPTWLRSRDVGYVDPTVTPLRAMSASAADILHLRDVLECMELEGQGWGR